jgi:hypothetical protein
VAESKEEEGNNLILTVGTEQGIFQVRFLFKLFLQSPNKIYSEGNLF